MFASMDAELPPWMRPGWEVLREGSVTAVVRRDFRPAFRELGLVRAADEEPAALHPSARPFRTAGGRGPLAVVPAAPAGEAVVRPYYRGGLPGRWIRRRYLRGQRAFDELVLTLELRRAGVPAVEPLAAVQSRRRPGYRAALVTRRVRDASPAPALLAAPERGPRREALRRMGRATRILHRAGGHHPDLNAYNYLIPDPAAPERRDGAPATGGRSSRPARPPAVLLDFDRARKLPVPLPGPLAALARRRLRRSLAKLGLERARADWRAFEAGYRGDGPEGNGPDGDGDRATGAG